MKIRLPFLLVIGLLSSCSPTPEFDLSLLNVQLIDMDNGTIEFSDIYIKDQTIQLIQKASEKDLNAIKQIDTKNAYIIPGLWDNHIHFRGGDDLIKDNETFLTQLIVNGITSVRDAGGDLTHELKKWKDQILKGERIGPDLFTSGPKIDGINPTWQGSLEVNSDASIDKALDSLEQLEVDYVKLYDSKLNGKLFLSTLTKSTSRGLKSSGHMPFSVTLNQSLEAGLNGVEHLYYILKGSSKDEVKITQQYIDGQLGFWDAMPLLQGSYDQTSANILFNKLKEKDVYVIPTLHIGRTLSYLDEVDHSQDHYLNLLSSAFKSTYQRRINSALQASEMARKNRKNLDTFFGTLTQKLHRSGVTLMAGSDAGAYNSYVYPGPSLHKELEALVEVGLSPLEALQTSVINGPKWLGVEDQYGSIKVGKKANLVLLHKNPLENIKNTTTITAVVKDGQFLSKDELNKLH